MTALAKPTTTKKAKAPPPSAKKGWRWPKLTHTPAPEPGEKKAAVRSGFSIGTKFLGLILFTLIAAVAVIVSTAVSMFKRDNLDNIYFASDLLTAAKASEVRFWLESVVRPTLRTQPGGLVLTGREGGFENILECARIWDRRVHGAGPGP